MDQDTITEDAQVTEAPPQDAKPKEYVDLSAWRKAREEAWTLPSGLQVVTRQGLSIMDLFEDGEIPDSLLGFYEMALSAGQTEIPTTEAEVDPKMLPGVMSAFNSMAKAALIRPPCKDQPTEDALGVMELSYEDKAAIFDRVQRGANAAAPFREGPKE